MPFTPFHFGPGLFVKGLVGPWFSWITFAAVQVVIDCETLYYLERHEYPIHRTLHTFAGATIAGIATAGIFLSGRWLARRVIPKSWSSFEAKRLSLLSESSTAGILAGGLIGGASHPLLDGLMHPDVRPFMPWTNANPLLGAVSLGTLHTGCVVMGLIGFIFLGVWLYVACRVR